MKYSIEELLKIAKEENLTKHNLKQKRVLDDVHRFILSMGIKPGKNEVSYTVLYKCYKMWSHKPLLRRGFLFRFSTYIKPKFGSHSNCYKLNYHSIQLLNKVDNLKIKIK